MSIFFNRASSLALFPCELAYLEFIRVVYLGTMALSAHRVAATLKVSPSTFTHILNSKSSVTPEMALRLSKTLGRSPESWLAMQNRYDLWQTRQHFPLWKLREFNARNDHIDAT